jgi:multidrug efflux pump subunit AcrB
MWIVHVALKRPYTFIVLAMLIVMGGVFAIWRTPTDIFPSIRIPVVSVVWSYSGLPAKDMSDRMIGLFERALSVTVNDIEHVESSSLLGVGVVKIYFQPSVNVDRAVAQVTAISQTYLRQFPPGTTPPLILEYDASSVPILQLALSSPTLLESQLFDAGSNFMRSQLSTVQGASIPYPYGGSKAGMRSPCSSAASRARMIPKISIWTIYICRTICHSVSRPSSWSSGRISAPRKR